MKWSWLSRDKDGAAIQACPLRKGFVNLEPLTVVTTPRVFSCVTDGAFVIIWDDDTEDTIISIEGDSAPIDGAKSLTISSGKFHVIGKSIA